MARIHGRDGRLYAAIASGGTAEPIAFLNSWSIDFSVDRTDVTAFEDSNKVKLAGLPDASGDFGGLTSRLDYLSHLGIDTIWLLPFYPSPLRDDGYDIAEYFDVHPSYGSLDDFTTFLDAAHARTSMSGATPQIGSRTFASFFRTRKPPTGHGIRWRAPTTGTVFSLINRTSTTTIHSCARPSPTCSDSGST